MLRRRCFPVGGNWVTVRGCAPFNTDHFSRNFQRSLVGTYWRGSSLFSVCDTDGCNAAHSVTRANVAATVVSGVMAALVAAATIKV